MLGRLGKPSPMFPPKKGEKGKEMLGRLLLALHWPAFIVAIVTTPLIILIAIFDHGDLGDISQLFSMTWSFLIVFTPFYWVVYKKWVFFPWKHVRPEE